MYKRPCLADAHLHKREGHRNCYCWSLKTVCAGLRRQESCGERSVLQTLLHSAALLHEKLPLVSVFLSSTETPEEKQLAVHWLHVRSHTYILLIRKMSIQVRSCTVHAEFGFQSMLFEDFAQFAELMVSERQVQAAIHFWSFPEGSTCHKNMFELFGRHP